MIGTLGNVFFEVSEDRVNTFQDLSFSGSASYAEHKISGGGTLIEFTGRNSNTCRLRMVFDASKGVKPLESVEALKSMMDSHELGLFMLDGKLCGSGYWVIDSLNWTAEVVDSFGGIHRASADISLKEYLEEG